MMEHRRQRSRRSVIFYFQIKLLGCLLYDVTDVPCVSVITLSGSRIKRTLAKLSELSCVQSSSSSWLRKKFSRMT
uniref:Secreted protein n=1 Tax=Steinernema glaseri TaxID=37863 RepID=A0A1I8A9T0_9BILA